MPINKTLDALVERAKQLKLRIAYYDRVALDPRTLDAEIARREGEVAAHLAAIARLKHDRDNAQDEADKLRKVLKVTILKANYKRLEQNMKQWEKVNASAKQKATRARRDNSA